MNYIGSKLKLSSWIKQVIKNEVKEDLSELVFCDLFAGTGIVGRAFKSEVKQVISNDIEHYSFVLNKNYIQNNEILPNSLNYIKKLNNLEPKQGFIYKNYCLGGGKQRQYFSDENGKIIDAMREKIQLLKQNGEICDGMYYFLLASLLECSDKVANTASVYGAFLKKLKKSALKKLVLKPANFEISKNLHLVYNDNANELIKKIKGDILYLDPPYNERQYGANYHILNTISLYDNFTPKGKTGLREYSKSKYCSKNSVKDEFEDLIQNANFKYIFLSYNNEGLMSEDEVKNTMSKYGKYALKQITYQRFRADKAQNRNHKANTTQEYLHVLHKK